MIHTLRSCCTCDDLIPSPLSHHQQNLGEPAFHQEKFWFLSEPWCNFQCPIDSYCLKITHERKPKVNWKNPQSTARSKVKTSNIKLHTTIYYSASEDLSWKGTKKESNYRSLLHLLLFTRGKTGIFMLNFGECKIWEMLMGGEFWTSLTYRHFPATYMWRESNRLQTKTRTIGSTYWDQLDEDVQVSSNELK